MALTVVAMIIALLASAAIARAGEANRARLLEPDQQFLPLLTKRHDPTLKAPVFGVQMYGSTAPSSKFFPYLVDSGSTWLRVPVSWSNIEPEKTEPATYYWASADQILSAARIDSGARSLIATISYNPEWAAVYRNGPINLDDLDSFAAFVQALVERYDGDGFQDAPGSPVITYWEFYNEPDESFEPGWGGEGDQYAHMLSVIYAPVKYANPSAQVLMGGLAYDWFDDQGGHFDKDFLEDVLNAGGGDFFDIMNFHVYPIFWYNWTDHKSPGLLEKANVLRDRLADYGYFDKPFVVTEAGWHSNVPGEPDDLDAGDPEDQARFVVELFTQSMAARLDIMIWWMLYDPGGTYPYENGLVTNDDIPQTKPAFVSYQVAESVLRSARFQRILPDSETHAPDMEAYEFLDRVNQRTVYVAWLDPIDAAGTKPLRVPGSIVTVRDIYGANYSLSDGQDGQVDGYVTVDVSGQPVYIEVNW